MGVTWTAGSWDGVHRQRRAGKLADTDASVGTTLVIVLASAYFGVGRLLYLLSGHQELACTAGGGILRLCEQAVVAWRNADAKGVRLPSAQALISTRTLTDSIITSVLAREGKRRWCGVADASYQAAEAFLRLYPGTRFLCMHRACPSVIRAALDASPWGIADAAFAPFTRAYPASTTAALTAYWLAQTQTLLRFERAHPEVCLGVRFEDLTIRQRETIERLTSFLGIACWHNRIMPAMDNQNWASDSPFPVVGFPTDLIPPMLLVQANDLLRELGYPALSAGSVR